MAVRRRPAPGARPASTSRSRRLASGLVHDAGIAPGDLVIDIGAGAGALTRALVDVGARVIALEADPGLAAGPRTRFQGHDVIVAEADARACTWPHEPFSVVANLPFAGPFREQRPLVSAPPGTVSRRELRRLAPLLGFDATARPRDLDARQCAALYALARSSRRECPRRATTRP